VPLDYSVEHAVEQSLEALRYKLEGQG